MPFIPKQSVSTHNIGGVTAIFAAFQYEKNLDDCDNRKFFGKWQMVMTPPDSAFPTHRYQPITYK
jgi:hypothetical protein